MAIWFDTYYLSHIQYSFMNRNPVCFPLIFSSNLWYVGICLHTLLIIDSQQTSVLLPHAPVN